jgi:hypothetical protein
VFYRYLSITYHCLLYPHTLIYSRISIVYSRLEKHAAQKKRWRENKKQDPEEAERIRIKNAENKRRSRARQLLKKQEEPSGDPADQQPPAKRRRVVTPDATEPASVAGPSNYSADEASSSHATGPSDGAGPSNHLPDVGSSDRSPDAGPSNHSPDAGLADHSLDAGPSNVQDVTPSTPRVIAPSNVTHDRIPIDPILLDQNMAESRQYANISVATNLHSTRDACVMTEPSSANDSTHASASTVDDFFPVDNDLASNMLGSEVPKESETVRWSDGSITVVPCIWKDGVNLCQNDAETVKNFATLPESLPGSEYVEHVHFRDWRSKPADLRELITETLRKNKAIVIRQMESPEQATFDVDYLEDNYGVSPYMRVVLHGKFINLSDVRLTSRFNQM